MHQVFVPLLLLVLAPLAYLAVRLRLLHPAALRWALAIVALGVVVASAAWGGTDFVYLKRMKLGLAAATATILLLRQAGALGLGERRRYRLLLAALALLAWLVDLNFLGFHGGEGAPRTFVHLHDVAHYYLGSKYFAEIGYTDLYTGMLRAEAERFDQRVKATDARDLRTNALVPVGELLARSNAIRDQFTPTRWAAFQDDVAFFRQAMGPQYGALFQDHGFNPTPVWVAVGGTIANLIPAGSAVGIRLLTLLDPLLEAALFAAVAWAFGLEAMLLAAIYYCVLFGTSFGWTGGAYLRYMWLAGVIGAVCCLQRARHGLAGALLAFATALRVFPIAFIAALAGKAAATAPTHGLERRYIRLLIAAGTTGLLLFLSTAWLGDGLERWFDFRSNMERHLDGDAFNTIGLWQILAFGVSSVAASPAQSLEWLGRLRWLQLLVVLPITALFVLKRARTEDDVGSAALGILLLFTGLDLAAYYYVCLLVLLLANRDRPRILALLFAVEAATYTLMLFEDREAVLYFYRNVLVAYLLIATSVRE